MSLAHRGVTEGSIQLHDLQLDYVRAQYPDKEVLKLIRNAVQLSSNAIAGDRNQIASQMVGRLLPFQNVYGTQDQAQIETGDVNEESFKDALPAAKMDSSNSTRFVAVRNHELGTPDPFNVF
jgi:hypothetical protein